MNTYEYTKSFLISARNPAKWIQPIETVALFDFQARNPSELTIRAGERILIAPKEIQNTQGMLNTGWGLATIDGQTAGIIPINYVKSPQQLRQEQQQIQVQQQQQQIQQQQPMLAMPNNAAAAVNPQLMNLSAAAFAPPPAEQISSLSEIPDFEIAAQPIGPPSTNEMVVANGFA